jgi:hypothetical protein
MAQGIISILHLTIHIERCWHRVANDEEDTSNDADSASSSAPEEWYDVWRFDFVALVLDGDSIIKTKAKEASLFVKKLFKSWGSISASDMQEVPDWMSFDDSVKTGGGSSVGAKVKNLAVTQLALALMKNPSVFLGSVGGDMTAMLGQTAATIKRVASEVMSAVTNKISEWTQEWLKKSGAEAAYNSVAGSLKVGWDWIKKHVGVDSRQLQFLRAGLTLSRANGASKYAPWSQEFELHYLGYTTLEMRVTVPGVVRVSSILAYVSDMDLSGYLRMFMSFVQGAETNTRLDSCLNCFSCGQMKCATEKGNRTNYGDGQMYAFCADERSAMNNMADVVKSSKDPEKQDQYSDQCDKLQVLMDTCRAQTADEEEAPPMHLLQIIEECQSLVPMGVGMR